MTLLHFRVRATSAPPSPSGAVPFAPFVGSAAGASGQFTVTWDAPALLADGSPIGTIASYTVYWGQTPGEQLNGGAFTGSASVAAGTLTKVVSGLAAGDWFVSVTCSNAVGEGDPSPEQQVTVT